MEICLSGYYTNFERVDVFGVCKEMNDQIKETQHIIYLGIELN